jgi:hypothetical protein
MRSLYLWQSSPVWLAEIAAAAWDLAFCLGAFLGDALLLVLALALHVMTGSCFAEGVLVLAGPLALVLPIFGTGAIVRLTERDPDLRSYPEAVSARRAIRWTLLLVPVALVTFPVAFAAGAWIRAIMTPVVIGAILWLMLGLPATVCRHLASLMQCVPRPDLVQFARGTLWLFVATATMWTAAAALASSSFSAGLEWQWIAPLCALLWAGVLLVSFVLLIRVTRALKEVQRRAAGSVSSSALERDRS